MNHWQKLLVFGLIVRIDYGFSGPTIFLNEHYSRTAAPAQQSKKYDHGVALLGNNFPLLVNLKDFSHF